MRVLFAGNPAIAVPTLEVLSNIKEIELAGVLTFPDTPRGRLGQSQPTDVGGAAQKLGALLGIPILKPAKLDAQAREQIDSLKCDLLITFAYGRIFGPKFLGLFPFGGINIHPSLLPKYRGPTPVQAAILNRDDITGVTIQKLALEMDQGDILMQEQVQLTGKETTGSLSETLADKAAQMLPEAVKKIALQIKIDGTITGIPQSRLESKFKVSYCSLISKDDGNIDWKLSAAEIEAKIRGFTPWPLCRTIHNGRELIILKADVFKGSIPDESPNGLPEKKHGIVLGIDKNDGILIQTGDGILAVTELQYQQKKALFWRDFLNGARDFSGSQLI